MSKLQKSTLIEKLVPVYMDIHRCWAKLQVLIEKKRNSK